MLNTFVSAGIPLSDQKYGIYCMAPPYLLHTILEYISADMTEVTETIICDDRLGNLVKAKIEGVHQRVFSDMARQSERNFPTGASCTGYLKNTTINSEETHGNVLY